MSKEKMLVRAFFTGALGVFLSVGVSHVTAQDPVIQPGDSEATCLDGDRKVCWSGPVGGGTGYKYWV
jgi:hypothetical protein